LENFLRFAKLALVKGIFWEHVFDIIEHEKPEGVIVQLGGQTALTAFLKVNVKYPYDDKMAKRQGVVMLRFIVEKDGSITNIETVPVKKEVEGTKAMEEEAIRVVKAMPKWEPGTQRGETVRVSFMMPFQFFLGDDKKMKKAVKKMK